MPLRCNYCHDSRQPPRETSTDVHHTAYVQSRDKERDDHVGGGEMMVEMLKSTMPIGGGDGLKTDCHGQ